MSSVLQKDSETQSGGGGDKTEAAAPPSATRGRAKAFIIFFVVLVIAAIAGTLYWLHVRQFESTDDAEVDGHLNAISSRVEGTVSHVYVDDNQAVKANDPLVDLDPRDYQVALDAAQAQLSQARTMVSAQQPNVPITQVQNVTNISGAEADLANAQAALATAERDVETARAKLLEAQANNEKAQSDLERYKTLIAKEEVSKQEFDSIASTAKAQSAAVAAAQGTVEADLQIVNQKRAQVAQSQSRLAQYERNAPAQLAVRRAAVVSEEAAAKTEEVQVEKAQLNLGYTKISAPIGGIVMKRSAEVGDACSGRAATAYHCPAGRPVGHSQLQRNTTAQHSSEAESRSACGRPQSGFSRATWTTLAAPRERSPAFCRRKTPPATL
jgi:membrane fusion protein (multidrug efflux system)